MGEAHDPREAIRELNREHANLIRPLLLVDLERGRCRVAPIDLAGPAVIDHGIGDWLTRRTQA